MVNTLYVLSIGSSESNEAVRDALLSRARCQLFSATSVWDISALLVSDKIDVAILHSSLSTAELRSCAAYIRHHLPAASILLMHAKSDILDDPMYDERIETDPTPEVLLAVIEKMSAIARRSTVARRKERSEWRIR
jgi:hypothetical protein